MALFLAIVPLPIDISSCILLSASDHRVKEICELLGLEQIIERATTL